MQWVLTRLAVGFKSVPLRTGNRSHTLAGLRAYDFPVLPRRRLVRLSTTSHVALKTRPLTCLVGTDLKPVTNLFCVQLLSLPLSRGGVTQLKNTEVRGGFWSALENQTYSTLVFQGCVSQAYTYTPSRSHELTSLRYAWPECRRSVMARFHTTGMMLIPWNGPTSEALKYTVWGLHLLKKTNEPFTIHVRFASLRFWQILSTSSKTDLFRIISWYKYNTYNWTCQIFFKKNRK